jgi:hypothetical protein
MSLNLPAKGDVASLPDALLAIMARMRQSIEDEFHVPMRESTFARLGALMATGADAESLRGHINHLLGEGMKPSEIWAVLYSIIGHIGMPKFVRMIPALTACLGEPPEEYPGK